MLGIGSFDGLHLGHRSLLARLLELAHQQGLPGVVYTFDQPTRVLLEGSKFLYTLAEKLKLLEELDIDEVIAVPFTPAMSQRSKESFLDDIRTLMPSTIVVGDDFRFGHLRAGNGQDLLAVCNSVQLMPMKTLDRQAVKSSRIRELLELGDVGAAEALLGRAYSARGVVVHGQQLGRSIGFPTANVAVPDGKLLPAGVFAVQMQLHETTTGTRKVKGMANVGTRPTVHGTEEKLEVFLFDFNENLYGQEVRVDFIKKLRAEKKFNGLAALQAQLELDKIAAFNVLSNI